MNTKTLMLSLYVLTTALGFCSDDEDEHIAHAFKKMPPKSTIVALGESTGAVIEGTGKAVESSGRAIGSVLKGAGDLISSVGVDNVAGLAKKIVKKS